MEHCTCSSFSSTAADTKVPISNIVERCDVNFVSRCCQSFTLPGPQVYYRGALGALIVYDISRPETFNSAAKVIH